MTASRVGFGVGAVGKDMVYALVSGFILYYYNSVLGVSGTFLGVVMMIARLFDAFDDPFMGVIVAKTRTRWGRFRPWIFIGALTNALMLYAVFAVPPGIEGGALLVWMSVAYLLWGFTYTIMDIPFWSLIPAITRAGSAREKLVVVGRACSAVGGFLPTALALLIVTSFPAGERQGFAVVAAFVAVFFFLAQVTTVALVREDPDAVRDGSAEHTPTAREMLTALVRNDQAMVVVVGIVVFNCAMYLTGQVAVYFFKYDIQNPAGLTLFAVFGVAAQILAMLSFPLLRRRLSTKAIMSSGIVSMIVGYVLLFTLATSGLTGIVELSLAALVIYIGFGLMTVISTVFLANTVDYGQWKTGLRNESVIFSMQAFVAKFASAFAVLVAGIGIDVIGLDPEAETQPGATLIGLRVLMLIVPIGALVFALVFLSRRYRLDDPELARIVAELEARRTPAEDCGDTVGRTDDSADAAIELRRTSADDRLEQERHAAGQA